jgi:hypothetical protein
MRDAVADRCQTLSGGAESAISALIPIRGGTNASWHQQCLACSTRTPLGVVRDGAIYFPLSRLVFFAVSTVLRMQEACNLRSSPVEPSPAVRSIHWTLSHTICPRDLPAKAQQGSAQPTRARAAWSL